MNISTSHENECLLLVWFALMQILINVGLFRKLENIKVVKSLSN